MNKTKPQETNIVLSVVVGLTLMLVSWLALLKL